MCGIFGLLSNNGINAEDKISVSGMASALKHRGPDEAGIYLDNDAIIGNTRLSILDLSGGTQPISNEDGSLWIVFNGEIFNYIELKEELAARNHIFKTSSDTEVILHLYEDYKEKCLDFLNGQFAIAIWDKNKKELFLARDRVGILPLHYAVADDKLIFASEIKSIFNVKNFKRSINMESIHQVFTYWTTLPGQTFFENVYEIQPGHYGIYNNGHLSTHKYWEPDFSHQFHEKELNLSDTEEKITELLHNAVKIRMRADVTIGAYLSGGLDSSGLSSLIKKYYKEDLNTFGISFEEESYDEKKWQDMMHRYLDTLHLNRRVLNSEIAESFIKVIYHTEKPLLRTAPVPMFLLSREVKNRNIKVVVTGEGADEIFGGYNIFKETYIRYFQARNPDSKQRADLLKNLYPYIFKDKRLAPTLKNFFMEGIENTGNPLFSHMIRWKNTSRIKNFLKRELNDLYTLDDLNNTLINILPQGFKSWNYFARAQFLEMFLFMSGYLLSSQGERMAMANSVEIRVPYLDHRIIELMQKLPLTLKLRGLNEKYMLKKIMHKHLPKEIITRPKNPYRAPVKNAFSSPEILGEMHCTKEEIIKAGIFDHGKTEKLFIKVQKNGSLSETESMAVVGIISTQLLWSLFIENFIPEPENNVAFKNYFDFTNEENKWIINTIQ